VVSGEWHEGVLGIIAGRLVEKYHKPAFVLSKTSMADTNGDGLIDIYKGSGRSFGDFNLAEAIKNCPSVQGGGHAAACGVKVLPENLEKFISEVNDYYETLGLSNQEEFLKVLPEFSVEDLADFSGELLDEIAALEPFGEGNAEPIFELKNVMIDEARAVGREGNHLRMVVSDEKNRKMTLVAFSAPEEWLNLTAGTMVSVIIQLTRNEWNGRTYVEGRILGVEKKIDI
jgi:single-stranded-DNA-specific exonuclease